MKKIIPQICLTVLLPLLCHADEIGRSGGSAKSMFDARELAGLQQAAKSGDTEAMFYIGSCFSDGIGVSKDEAEGLKWYRKAAEAGGKKGMFILACKYGNGIGAPKDDTESSKWFRKLADSGDVKSMYQLGRNYVQGSGVPEDFVQAYKWFNLAAARGDQSAGKTRDRLASAMTNEQIAEALKLCSEWKPTPIK